ncbi:EpsG family protein, partial [Vibrio vulnificus]
MFWFFYYSSFLFFLYLNKKTKRSHTALLVFMLFFLGQRWMTGEDFPGYLLYYLIDFQGGDLAFFSLQNVFKYFEFSFSFFVMFLYVITLFATFKFINKFEYASLVFIVFSITELSFIQLSQLKQSLSIPFFLFSYYYIYNKKYTIGLLFIVLSSSIHLAALFLVPFVFIKLPAKKNIITLLLLFICIFPFINITEIVPTSLYFKFSHYLESDYNQALSYFHYIKLYG